MKCGLCPHIIYIELGKEDIDYDNPKYNVTRALRERDEDGSEKGEVRLLDCIKVTFFLALMNLSQPPCFSSQDLLLSCLTEPPLDLS